MRCADRIQARRQIGRNMTIVFGMVLPACTGIWLTLPSIQLSHRAGTISRPLQRPY